MVDPFLDAIITDRKFHQEILVIDGVKIEDLTHGE
jgi:hypothetical protein